MKTFFKIIYSIILVVIIFTTIPFVFVSYIQKEYSYFGANLLLIVTCIVILSLIISKTFRHINNKFEKLIKTSMDIYNHHINTHNKVLDICSVVKESSRNILVIDKIIKSTERQGKVNQDTLSQIRDIERNNNIYIKGMQDSLKFDETNLAIIKDNQKYIIELLNSKTKRTNKTK